jgi:glutamate carboxypeptidase
MKKFGRTGAAILALMAGAIAANAAPQRDDKVFAAANAGRDGALALLKQIVNIDSGTGDVAGGNKVASILADKFKALGGDVRVSPAEKPGFADNLVAVFHGTGKGRILIVAHIDTVFGPGTAAKRPFTIIGDKAHGPGVQDCKAGVTATYAALKILHDLNYRNYGAITVILDGSEEMGSPGSVKLIKTLAAQSDAEFNLEGGFEPDSLIVWRKGSSNIRLDVTGREAHAGVAPQNGRNAITELMHQLAAIEAAFPRSGDGTTVNVTLIGGGERTNIIPGHADASINVRFRKPEDFTAVLDKIRQITSKPTVPDTKVVLSTDDSPITPMISSPAQDEMVARAKAIYGELGKSLGGVGSGGASESGFAVSVGTPALDGLGYVGADNHSDREIMELNSVVPRIYLLTRLLMDMGSAPPVKAH